MLPIIEESSDDNSNDNLFSGMMGRNKSKNDSINNIKDSMTSLVSPWKNLLFGLKEESEEFEVPYLDFLV